MIITFKFSTGKTTRMTQLIQLVWKNSRIVIKQSEPM